MKNLKLRKALAVGVCLSIAFSTTAQATDGSVNSLKQEKLAELQKSREQLGKLEAQLKKAKTQFEKTEEFAARARNLCYLDEDCEASVDAYLIRDLAIGLQLIPAFIIGREVSKTIGYLDKLNNPFWFRDIATTSKDAAEVAKIRKELRLNAWDGRPYFRPFDPDFDTLLRKGSKKIIGFTAAAAGVFALGMEALVQVRNSLASKNSKARREYMQELEFKAQNLSEQIAALEAKVRDAAALVDANILVVQELEGL